jgi:hypothetical protein
MIKIFKCGLCKEKDRIGMTRKGLRKHLREEHLIKRRITNKEGWVKGEGYTKQRWWLTEKHGN